MHITLIFSCMVLILLCLVYPTSFYNVSTIPDKSLGTLAHFCSICLRNLSVHPPPDSMLFMVMNLSLLISNIVWGEGVHYSSDIITDCFQKL